MASGLVVFLEDTDADAALDALVAERDEALARLVEFADVPSAFGRAKAAEAEVKRLAAVESAAHWLVSNRGHRGEEQAWRLLEEALGIHPPALRDDEEGKHNR